MIHIEIRKALNTQILFCKIRQRYRCGIFVTNKDKEAMIYNYLANTLMKHKNTRNEQFSLIEFPNGSIIKIMQPNEYVRGRRYNGMIVDSDINDKIVKEIMLPLLTSLTPYEFKDSSETTKMIMDKPSNRLYYCSICENDFKKRGNKVMKKILMVVDMQNDFIDGALGTKEAEAIVPNVIEKIKNFDGEIFVTYDTHQNNYMNTREGKYLPVPHCIEGTDGWNLNKDVENVLIERGNINRIYKPTFGSTKLVEILKEMCNKIQSESGENAEVTLVGLCTDICVVSNVMLLKANFPEMDIIVDASCCAGVTPESHNAALTTMKSCQICVIGE